MVKRCKTEKLIFKTFREMDTGICFENEIQCTVKKEHSTTFIYYEFILLLSIIFIQTIVLKLKFKKTSYMYNISYKIEISINRS